MTRWDNRACLGRVKHTCRKIDLSFFDTARERLKFDVELDCTPDRLFEILEDAEAWPRWARGLKRVEWTSPRPFGVGTTRTVDLLGGPQVYEEFIAWEHGTLLAFHFVGASERVWDAFGERYDVTPLPGGRCRWVWTVAYEPVGYYGKLHPWIRPLMRWALGGFTKKLQEYVRKQPVPADLGRSVTT